MDYASIILLFDGLIAFGAAIYSLAYLLKWRNGKTITSALSIFLFAYLGYVHLSAFFGHWLFGLSPFIIDYLGLDYIDRATYGARYVRPFLPLVYGMIVAHTYIDWVKNAVNNIDTERRIFQAIHKKFKKGNNV